MDAAITHQYSFRVYAEDVDFMGIVYHANYLCFLERARTEFLRSNNLILSELMKQDILFAIHDVHIRYKAPARLDDLVTINTQIQQLGACSFLFDQVMQNQDKKIICEAKIQVVCVNSHLRPKRFPL
jgi:acyl-CoA thioester hydrolase